MSQASHPQSPLQLYKFCPKCGGKFIHRGGNHLKCQDCGYSYFVNQAPTAGVIIFDNEGRVMLVKRKFEPKKGTWQSIGGFVGLDESLEEAAMREAKEELGVTIQIEAILAVFPKLMNSAALLCLFWQLILLRRSSTALQNQTMT